MVKRSLNCIVGLNLFLIQRFIFKYLFLLLYFSTLIHFTPLFWLAMLAYKIIIKIIDPDMVEISNIIILNVIFLI